MENRTPDELRAKSPHVLWSLRQLLGTEAHLRQRQDEGVTVMKEPLDAAALEAFAVHARALIEFLWRDRQAKPKPRKSDALATDGFDGDIWRPESDRWRPWYRMASEGQHAGSRALAYTLGVIAPAEARLTGASNAGLAEPGSGTALSLAQASTAFLTFRPDLRAVQAALAILQLSREVEERFDEASVRLDADEMRARQEREPGDGPPHWRPASLIGD